MRPVGLETAFSIDLAHGAPALRGLGVVVEAWPTPGNRFGRPGLLLGIRKLTADSEGVFERLLAAHVAATPPPTPAPIAAPLSLPPVVADGERTPGSELVLPANPLMNISDHSLEGFVDCTLYEETGNFFPVPEGDTNTDVDALAEPPVLAPRRVTIPPIAEPRTITGPVDPRSLIAEPRTITGPVMAMRMSPTAITAAIPPPLPPMPTPQPLSLSLPIAAQTPPMPTPVPAHLGGPVDMPLSRPMVRREPEPAQPQQPQQRLQTEPNFDHIAMRPSRRRSITNWPRRRLVVAGSVAVATITIAIIAVAAGSSHAKVATPSSPPLIAANMPPSRQARPESPRPVAVADVAPAAAAPADDPADTGGTPTFGSGPCKIAVSTTPAGSIVSVDGEIAGPSPITIGGPCAKRKLDIAHPRYAPATRLVTATPDAAPVDVALARPTHDLYVETQPSGAIVEIDGHRAGTTPTLVKIMGFTSLSLKVEKFGFKATSQKIYSKTPHDRVSIRLGH